MIIGPSRPFQLADEQWQRGARVGLLGVTGLESSSSTSWKELLENGYTGNVICTFRNEDTGTHTEIAM